MTDTPDDTQTLLDALKAALDASNAPEQREKRERLATISREAEDLSAAITAADLAVTNAERALAAHLAAKHAPSPQGSQTAQQAFRKPVPPREGGAPHEEDCGVYFGEVCNCP